MKQKQTIPVNPPDTTRPQLGFESNPEFILNERIHPVCTVRTYLCRPWSVSCRKSWSSEWLRRPSGNSRKRRRLNRFARERFRRKLWPNYWRLRMRLLSRVSGTALNKTENIRVIKGSSVPWPGVEHMYGWPCIWPYYMAIYMAI